MISSEVYSLKSNSSKADLTKADRFTVEFRA